MKLWPIPRRHRWPLAALAIMLVAGYGYWLIADEPAMDAAEPTSAGPVSVPASSPAAADQAAAPPPENPPPDTPPEPPAGPVNIFAVRNWEPPAPIEVPPEAAAPPPPPQAPPLPFRYAGKLEEPGKAPIIFLAKGEQILAVSPGDLINGNYRVGKLEGGQLHFLYRPMKIQQSLAVGGDS